MTNLDANLGGQLDLFAQPPPAPPGAYDEPDNEPKTVVQLTELPGHTFEDIFGDAT